MRAALFEAACEHAFESVMITTAEADHDRYPIVYVNEAFTAMTGYSVEEVIGKTPAILQGPKTDAAVLERLAADLSAGRLFHGQAINYRKDGSEFAIEWKVVPVADVQGAVTHFVAVQRETR
jgi:PAS domain S-box-containing protein